MHTEHLRNVQFSWVAFGWFVALAVTSGLVMVMSAAGLLYHTGFAEMVGVVGVVAVGWGVGGFITGYKTAGAPILHGAAMAGFTFVVWFLLNLTLGGLTTGASAWELIPVRTAAMALLVQGGASIVGCWLGYRYAPVRID